MQPPGQETRWGALPPPPNPCPHTALTHPCIPGPRSGCWGSSPALLLRFCPVGPAVIRSTSRGAPHSLVASVHKDEAVTSHCADRTVHRLTRSPQQPCEAVTTISSTFQMGKLRHREAKCFATN